MIMWIEYDCTEESMGQLRYEVGPLGVRVGITTATRPSATLTTACAGTGVAATTHASAMLREGMRR